MELRILLLVVALLASGCASFRPEDPLAVDAARLGVSKEEFAVVAAEVTEKHKLIVLWVLREHDGALKVFLSNVPNGMFGIAVVYRRIDGRWQEDPGSIDHWII